MHGLPAARAARIAVAAALLVVGLLSGALVYTTEASNDGPPVVTPPPCQSMESVNPGDGPTNATQSSDGKSEEGAPGLCLALVRSGGSSPAPVVNSTCAGLGATTITIQSHRGFGWVC